MKNLERWLFATTVVAIVCLSSCSTIEYGFQAASGQAGVLSAARPIESWVNDPTAPPSLRTKLGHAMEIREFASTDLGLPNNGSYRSYADLGRNAVVWNVFAAEPFSVAPKTWCFPIAGCVPYRGYYDRAGAIAFANELESRGLEVYVGPVTAYSTLGWFNDPLLNTFINSPDRELARLMFHELAHQLIYVSSDTEFNESFATTVERIGVQRWLTTHGSQQDRDAWKTSRTMQEGFQTLVLKHQHALRRLYSSAGNRESMQREKAALTDKLRSDYALLKIQWGGDSRYDRFFAGPLNNAQLASFAVYTRLVPAFETLYTEHNADLGAFYSQVRGLAKLPHDMRVAQLNARLAP